MIFIMASLFAEAESFLIFGKTKRSPFFPSSFWGIKIGNKTVRV